jgi:hypothetical protein
MPALTPILAALVSLQAAAASPATIPPAADQIAAAVQAAPEEWRADATVLGYDAAGAVVTLRKGANDLVCLADNPKDSRFSVACYHKDLEPFMARGRELVAQGMTGEAREKQRWGEVESGALKMPREPRALYVLSGGGFDSATRTVKDADRRWVIYTPYATTASTGLSTTPIPGGPWLMFPGTPSAHIMIVPAK